jgi:hypothetical protein
VREIVIVIADLYLPREAQAAGALAAPPALAQLLRFGTRSSLAGGSWREWLARWLGRADLAAVPVAHVAAAAAGLREADGALWLATPMHWVATLGGVHLDGRAIVRLGAAELEALAADFNAAFRHSAVALRPLESGELLALGPDVFTVRTVEPARARIGGLAESLPSGIGAATLRRLGAEIEMWLRDQAVNRARAARGDRTVSALWFWGGPSTPEPAVARLTDSPATVPTVALGADAFLAGMARLCGAEARALPRQLGASLAEARTTRLVLVLELAELAPGEAWTPAAALGEADGRFIAPALAALRSGSADLLTLLANDRCVALRGNHRLRLWRRARPGLAALA